MVAIADGINYKTKTRSVQRCSAYRCLDWSGGEIRGSLNPARDHTAFASHHWISGLSSVEEILTAWSAKLESRRFAIGILTAKVCHNKISTGLHYNQFIT